jgi:hypothetical protein
MYEWLLSATDQVHRLPIIALEGSIRPVDWPEFLPQLSKLGSCTEVRLAYAALMSPPLDNG